VWNARKGQKNEVYQRPVVLVNAIRKILSCHPSWRKILSCHPSCRCLLGPMAARARFTLPTDANAHAPVAGCSVRILVPFFKRSTDSARPVRLRPSPMRRVHAEFILHALIQDPQAQYSLLPAFNKTSISVYYTHYTALILSQVNPNYKKRLRQHTYRINYTESSPSAASGN
jgi:hypothetical protein